MPLILHIETSTPICSIAISRHGELLAQRCNAQPNSHSAMTAVYIQSLLSECQLRVDDLDAISVSRGPGSYTGLRIGVASAKGLCFAIQKPLIAVDALQCAALSAAHTYPEFSLFCPMLDARRMEVYAAIYDAHNACQRTTQADIVESNTYEDWLNQGPMLFLGDGAPKCQTLLSQHPNAHFRESLRIEASQQIPLAITAYHTHDFADTAYFEPFYLKDFVAGTPHVKGLRS